MTFAEWLASDTPAAKAVRHMVDCSPNPDYYRAIAEFSYEDGRTVQRVIENSRLEFAEMPVTAGRVQ